MSLQSILAPHLATFRDTAKDFDIERSLSFYTQDALMINIVGKTVQQGHKELHEVFTECSKNSDWKPSYSEEEFIGGDELIKYSFLCTLHKDGKEMMKLYCVQYWRKQADSSFKIELETYSYS
ncbi:unnamed protein product, partial [Mesorhabditis spiculigera]